MHGLIIVQEFSVFYFSSFICKKALFIQTHSEEQVKYIWLDIDVK